MNKVLAAVPVWHRYPRSLRSIHALQPPPQGALHTVFLAFDDPYSDGTRAGAYKNITHKYNQARQMALAGGYDALLLVEDDMVVPANVVPRLLAAHADIAYGLTCWRHGTPGWSARLRLNESGQVVNLSDYRDEAWRLAGRVVDVAGTGTFCTLIRRHVLERLEFRLNSSMPDLCCDWWMSVDAQRAGLSQRADLSVICGHITPDPSPRIIWPDPEETRLWRMEPLDD